MKNVLGLVALKRVKNELRTTMAQSRMTARSVVRTVHWKWHSGKFAIWWRDWRLCQTKRKKNANILL